MKTVLFVDDEVQVLKTINRVFMDTGYSILLADSAKAALNILSETAVDILVTDMRMPDMDGIELLRYTKKNYPKIVRIILSGYADESEITYTLQNNLAKAYLFKPWNNDDLLNVVGQNLEDTASCLPNEITSYINNLEKLPTISNRYQKVLDAINDNKDIERISAVIEKDQTITAKVLQIVNSAYYGMRTGSVRKALSCIGINDLENLVKSMEIMEYMSDTGAGSRVAERVWSHAYYTSKIQNVIQTYYLRKKASHYGATAGLLHKIGIVFMIKYYGKDYISLLQKFLRDKEGCLRTLEEDKFGFSHPALSAYLLRWWNVPDQIVETAAFYNVPTSEDVVNKELLHTVHIAQYYSCLVLDMTPFSRLLPESFDYLGIDKAAFEAEYQSLI